MSNPFTISAPAVRDDVVASRATRGAEDAERGERGERRDPFAAVMEAAVEHDSPRQQKSAEREEGGAEREPTDAKRGGKKRGGAERDVLPAALLSALVPGQANQSATPTGALSFTRTQAGATDGALAQTTRASRGLSFGPALMAGRLAERATAGTESAAGDRLGQQNGQGPIPEADAGADALTLSGNAQADADDSAVAGAARQADDGQPTRDKAADADGANRTDRAPSRAGELTSAANSGGSGTGADGDAGQSGQRRQRSQNAAAVAAAEGSKSERAEPQPNPENVPSGQSVGDSGSFEQTLETATRTSMGTAETGATQPAAAQPITPDGASAAPTAAPQPLAAAPDGAAASTAASPTSAGAPSGAAWEQALERVSVLATEGGGEARVALAPEGLGRLDVKVELQDGRLHVTLMAERGETQGLLSRESRHLTAALAESGFEGARVDVESGGADERGARSGGAQTDADGGARHGDGERGEEGDGRTARATSERSDSARADAARERAPQTAKNRHDGVLNVVA